MKIWFKQILWWLGRLPKGFDPSVRHQVGTMNSTTPKNLRKERPTHAMEALWRLAAGVGGVWDVTVQWLSNGCVCLQKLGIPRTFSLTHRVDNIVWFWVVDVQVLNSERCQLQSFFVWHHHDEEWWRTCGFAIRNGWWPDLFGFPSPLVIRNSDPVETTNHTSTSLYISLLYDAIWQSDLENCPCKCISILRLLSDS